MKKASMWFIGIGAVLLLLVLWVGGSYNGLVSTKETVDSSWAQVENQLQRRADLIPNLVNTVQGFADQEQEIFTEVTKLRSQWGAAATRDEQIANAGATSSAISRLLLVAENYPTLKSNENFLALQSQLEGTENRISVERKRYNDAVRAYNVKTKRFPTVVIANMFGFSEEQYFEVEEGKEAVPEVSFN